MPNISVVLPEISQSVTRPVIFDVISQVRAITAINPKTKIFFPGDSQKMSTPGTTIDSEDGRHATFNTNYIVFIEVQEDYDHETLGSTAVTRQEHIPVFKDTKLGVHLTPVYATSRVTINFKYRCPSKTEALKWRDDVRVRVSQLRDVNLHSLTYHYVLPIEQLLILKTIHTLREQYLPYGESLAEYVTNHATPRLTLVEDLVGQDTRLAISERQCRVVGVFGWDGIPEPPQLEGGTWTIEFSYEFSYEKPIACNMRYPVMVHQSLMPSSYVYGLQGPNDLYATTKSRSLSIDALSGFESDTTMDNRVTPHSLIRLPAWDDYTIPSVPKGTGSVWIALTEVDRLDQRTLLNLNELGDIAIDAEILEFITTIEYPYICQLYKSIFQLQLYRNNYLTNTTALQCDSSLNIKATEVLDLRNQYRVRLSLVVDLTLLPKEALDRLRRYPKVLVKVIAAMNELLRNRPDFNDLGNLSYITNLQFNAIYAMMTGYSFANGQGDAGGNYYGSGLRLSSWHQGTGGLFSDIPNRTVEQYRRNAVGMNQVMTTGIVAVIN